jgi:hypothetical protein
MDNDKTNQVSDKATVKNDIPSEPTALADDELHQVAGGTAMYNGDVNITVDLKAKKLSPTLTPKLP